MLTLLLIIAIHAIVYLLPGNSGAKRWLPLMPILEYVFTK